MTINTTSNSVNTAFTMNNENSIFKMSNYANTSASSTSTAELSEEEKNYDTDGDGTLSVTEKAAYLEAQATKRTLESVKNTSSSEDSDAVSISESALRLQKEGGPNGPPPDVNEMSDDDLKSMLSDMKNKDGNLPKELSSYNDTDIEDLSAEDLQNIRETMTEMQEKMNRNRTHQPENQQYSLMEQAISAYSKFK